MWKVWWYLLGFNTAMSLTTVVKIGAIFTEETKGSSSELAFKYAVYKINKEKTILPNSTLVYDIQYTTAKDSFRAYKKACIQAKSGVIAYFTPGEPYIAAAVSSLANTLNLPHFDINGMMEENYDNLTERFTLNLHPSRVLLNNAFSDLVSYLNFTRIGIVYEDYGLGELSIVKFAKDGRDMYTRRCADSNEYRHALSQLKLQNVKHIFIDTDPIHLHKLFRAILQLQMNNEEYHYIFTSFDIELFDLEDFYYNRVNFSGWSLIDRDSVMVREKIQVIKKFHPIGASIINDGYIKSFPALLYDAVQVFALGLANMKMTKTFNVSCDSENIWSEGRTFYDHLNKVKFEGLTGPIQFDNGLRSDFKLQLMRISPESESGKALSGYWTPKDGLEITDPAAYRRDPPPNVTLTVVTVEEKPYVMVKDGWNLQGNARFEGFCIDLLARVAARAGFHYKLRLVPDKKYGVRDPETGQWNGIVKELVDRKADIAVASMTINYAREAVIDFTKPFMNLGIGILFKVPTSQPTRLFSFLNPLAIEIWLYVMSAYILVSFTLFVMARFSPYEWSSGVKQCSHETKLLTNQFSVCNSFWFITGTFLRQGSGLNPKATSTRIVGGIWWFFTLIILSSYTANLAAFLTVERTVLPIQNAADLAAQTSVHYGTLNGGSTMTFFRDSNIDIYKKMWTHMSNANPPALVGSYEDGVKKVLAGNYAFLMESTMLDHRVQRDCNLTQIGGLLDSKGYGIATWKGSPWRDKISLAILELQEKGVIQILYDKWWRNTGDVCNRDAKDSKANPLGVQHIGGVFVTLLCGLALAILVAILEFCWNSKKNATEGRQSLCSEMGQELRTAIQGGNDTRPVLRGSCTRCSPTHVPTPARYNEDPSNSSVELKELRWS